MHLRDALIQSLVAARAEDSSSSEAKMTPLTKATESVLGGGASSMTQMYLGEGGCSLLRDHCYYCYYFCMMFLLVSTVRGSKLLRKQVVVLARAPNVEPLS